MSLKLLDPLAPAVRSLRPPRCFRPDTVAAVAHLGALITARRVPLISTPPPFSRSFSQRRSQEFSPGGPLGTARWHAAPRNPTPFMSTTDGAPLIGNERRDTLFRLRARTTAANSQARSAARRCVAPIPDRPPLTGGRATRHVFRLRRTTAVISQGRSAATRSVATYSI